MHVHQIIERLRPLYPTQPSALYYRNSYELLIATILLAQSDIDTVNNVTPELFGQFPTPEAIAAAPRRLLEVLIRPTGFGRQKAKYLQLSSRMLMQHHDGELPCDFIALTKMPGLSRRGVNQLMAELWDKAEGIVVDTGVRRMSVRLGLARGKSAEAIENSLMQVVPQDHWIEFAQLLMAHGEELCQTQQPHCVNCPLKDFCPSSTA